MFCQLQKRQSSKIDCTSSANKDMLDCCMLFASGIQLAKTSLFCWLGKANMETDETVVACEALSLTCQHLNPVKKWCVCGQLPLQVDCLTKQQDIFWDETSYLSTRRHDTETLVKDSLVKMLLHPSSFISKPFKRGFALVKRIWTMTDVFRDGCLWAMSHEL